MRVHVDAAAAMTGVSRFGERFRAPHGAWEYSKDEGLRTAREFARFDLLVTADPARAAVAACFAVIGERDDDGGAPLAEAARACAAGAAPGVVDGFERLDLRRAAVVRSPQIYLMRRRAKCARTED